MRNDLVVSSLRAAVVAVTPRVRPALVVGAVALVLLAAAAPSARGYSPGGAPQAIPVDELKQMYLACNRAATASRMSSGSIMQCSIVYEELKRRAFGGDFDELLAWSRAQPPVRTDGRRLGEQQPEPER